jgi:chromosome segregation ATPase
MTHHTPKRIGHVYVPQNIASQIAEMQNEIKELSLQVESLKETVKTCQETIEQLIYHPKSPFIQDVRDDWERRALDLDKKSI